MKRAKKEAAKQRESESWKKIERVHTDMRLQTFLRPRSTSLSPFFSPAHFSSHFYILAKATALNFSDPALRLIWPFFFYYFHLSSAKVISHALSNLSHQNQSVSHAPSKTGSMEFHSSFEGGIKKRDPNRGRKSWTDVGRRRREGRGEAKKLRVPRVLGLFDLGPSGCASFDVLIRAFRSS